MVLTARRIPGNLSCKVVYSLSKTIMGMEIEAVTDKPTVVNLTNHTYFNLAGEGDPTVLDHLLTLPGASQLYRSAISPICNQLLEPFDFVRLPWWELDKGEHPQLVVGKCDHTLVSTFCGDTRTCSDSLRPRWWSS